MRITPVVGGALVAGLLLLAGCTGSNESPVSGTVTVDEKMVEKGSILFIPADGKTATAGGEIKDGRYSVRVPPGPKKVSISMPKITGQKPIYPGQANSPMMDITVEGLPVKYNDKTELTFEVKPGSNTQDWPLKSK